MKLKFYRIENSKTQKEVAAYLGVAESTYSLYENEKRKIGLEDLLKLGELYGCTVDDLVNGTKNAATPKDDGALLRFALYGDPAEEITDDDIERILDYARYVREKRKGDSE